MENNEQVPLSQFEAAYLAGDLTETEYLFHIDSTSPQEVESVGGLRRSWAVLLIVFSLLGMLTSVALLYEEYIHTQYPFAALGCTLNAKISCVDAFDAWQGHLIFGIPNAVPGLLAFTGLLGVSIYLTANKTLPRYLWLLLLGAVGGGNLMVFWFLYVSLTVFHALCPLCLIVWATVINLFWLVIAVVLRQKLSPANPPKPACRLVIRFWFLLALTEILFIVVVVFTQLGLVVLGF